MKNFDGTYTIVNVEDFDRYWSLIEKLINKRKTRNERQAKATREKRKINPLYGRSKKEKERILNKIIDKI